MCVVRRVIWRGTANPKLTADNPVLELVGRTKQVGQEQRSKGASSVVNLDILQGSASRGGQGSSVVVLLQSRKTTLLWIRVALIMRCATRLSFLALRAGTKGQLRRPPFTLSRIKGKWSVEVEIRDCHDVVRSYTFQNVRFVPSYRVNLITVSTAVARASSFIFAADASHRLAPDGRQLTVKQRSKLFFLECKFKRNPMTLVTKTRSDTSDAMLSHRWLGHLNQQDLSSLVNVGELELCEVCTASEMQKVAVPKKTDSRASAVGQRVFSDFQGPSEVPSMYGTRYALLHDDISRLAVVKYVVKKSDALLKFLKEFVAEYGAGKCLRTDNGGELSSNSEIL